MKRADSLDKAVRARANLNTFNALVSILEGGNIYGGNPRTDRVTQKIIGLCHQEQQRLLKEYDAASEIVLSPDPVNPHAKEA